MNKFLRGLLVFSLAASLVLGSVPAMAEEADYTNELSDYVRTFDESENIESYLDVLGEAADGHFQSIYDDEGNSVLRLGGTSDDAPAKNYNSGGALWQGAEVSGVKLEFKVKRDNSKLGGFCVYGDNKDVFLMLQNKVIYFLGTKVSEYEANVWYDIRLSFDFSVGFASLSVKKSEESEWFTVTSAAGATINSLTDIAVKGNWKAMPEKITGIYISHYRNTAKDRTVTLIDDLMLDEWVNETGSRDFLEDDFAEGINAANESAQPMLDSLEGWLLDSGADVIAGDSAVITVPAGTQGAGISKKPFYSAPSSRQRIRFKLSVPTEGGEAIVSASFNNSAVESRYLPIENAQRIALLKISADKIVLGDEQYAVSLLEDELYECEIVYMQKEKSAKIALIDSDGNQYTGRAGAGLSAVFGAESDWGNLSEIAVCLKSDSENSVSASFDDFDWDLGLNYLASIALAEGQSTESAPLDPTIFFTFGETVDSAKTIGIDASNPGTASLSVLEEGEEAEVPYTLEWVEGGVLKCTLARLGTKTGYSVSLAGVTLLSGEEAEALEISFETSGEEVTVAEPEFSNGTLTIDVSTGYAEGKPLAFIAVEYDSTGAITNVTILEETVGREQETLTINGLSGASKVGALLWSDFITQVPYMEKKVFDVE